MACLAIGQTLVILTAGIDLSAGAIAVFTSIIMANLTTRAGLPGALALLVGFLISLFQAATQIQEPTLSFVPKAAAVGAALLFSGNWMLHEMTTYTTQLFARIPELIG